ncbi:hypothetical protein ERD95_15425 [Enterobacteriaceae bacterium ML5]|nr:hypothetical protein ERD95_15425 [Enterobacteriaceae bacterium ML5]
MPIPTLSGPRANALIWGNAALAIRRYQCGRRNFSRIKPHGYFVIRVCLRWRLLSKDGGQHWQLMTHEKYNKAAKR